MFLLHLIITAALILFNICTFLLILFMIPAAWIGLTELLAYLFK